MRAAAVLAAAALCLAGCEHMYGAVDVGLTDPEAIQIARRDAARRHVSLDGLRAKVHRFDTGTTVTFENPACEQGCIDGLPVLFFIPAGKRRVSHFHDGAV